MRISLGFKNYSFTTPTLSVFEDLPSDFVISSGFKSVTITFIIGGAHVAQALVVTF